MVNEIDRLIHITKEKFHLENYFLKRYHCYKNVNIFNEVFYTLSMEWFPEHLHGWGDTELNPDGTVVIDIDIQQQEILSVIFVGEKSFVNQPLLNHVTKNNVIQWIENETGLRYEEQFHLQRQGDYQYSFIGSFNGIPVYPTSYLKIKFNKLGKLIHFSMDGYFPNMSLIQQDKFNLSLNQIEKIASKQLKLITLPDDQAEQMQAIYGIEETFLKNDDLTTLPYDIVREESHYIEVNKTFNWQSALQDKFEKEELFLSAQVTSEQALSHEQVKVLNTITEIEQEKCYQAVKTFLRQQYPTDSGKWQLGKLYRKSNYIVALVKPVVKTGFIFQRKLTIFIDQESFEVVNFLDNQVMLDIFAEYKQPGKPQISQENAFNLLSDKITLDPFYVFHNSSKKYVLCGKLDCQYGVDASSGHIINLNEL